MKNLLLPALMICLIFSCTKEDERPEMTLIGEWELVKSIGSFEGAVQEGDDLEWVETYLFKSDSTFAKGRETDQGAFQATGKYSTKEAG